MESRTGTVQLSGSEDFGPISVPAKVILQWHASKPLIPVPLQEPAKAASLQYLTAVNQIIAFTANANVPRDGLHAHAQAVLHIAVDRVADELSRLHTVSGAIPDLKRMARQMITSACAQEFIQIYWSTLYFIQLKYHADAASTTNVATSGDAETSRWIRDLKNVVEALSEARCACTWDFTSEVQKYGAQCFDEISAPYIIHLLNCARVIANKHETQQKMAIFYVLDMYEALVCASDRIEALFSTKKQLICCTTESMLAWLADRGRVVLAYFEMQILSDSSAGTSKLNIVRHGREIHPLTTEVMNYATSLVERRPALDQLLGRGEGADIVSTCVGRVRLLISNLMTKLRDKAEAYPYAPVGAGFLCRNLKYMLKEVRKSGI